MSYCVKVKCTNCEWDGFIEIPDGKLIKSQPCPTCKCQRLIRKYSSSGWLTEQEYSESQEEEGGGNNV